MAFKRKRNGYNGIRSRAMGSRRTVRRRGRSTIRRRRIPMSRGINTESRVSQGLIFRSKKVRPSVYRRFLWNDTLFKTHYRSVQTLSASILAPGNTTQMNMGFITGTAVNATPFWLTTGGLQDVDFGIAPPTFGNSITVRGGTSTLALTNTSLTESTRIKVWCIWAAKDINTTKFNAATSSVRDWSWDPTTFPDFRAVVGRVIYVREALLLPGQRSIEYSFRYRPHKIDKSDWDLASDPTVSPGNMLYWVFGVSSVADLDGLGATVVFTRGYNLSFSADEVIAPAP